MLEALLTLVSVAFGGWYIWLKAGDAMRAAWASVKHNGEAAPDSASVVMSRREETRGGINVVSGDIVPAQNDPPPARELTEREVAQWLARRKTANTANLIYQVVGGNRNDVLAWVREARGGEDDADPAREVVVRQRDNERRIPMVTRRERYYPDAPDLEYQEP